MPVKSKGRARSRFPNLHDRWLRGSHTLPKSADSGHLIALIPAGSCIPLIRERDEHASPLVIYNDRPPFASSGIAATHTPRFSAGKKAIAL